ncbi:putative membrane protein YGL010W [Sinobacterium caligoides]|uniref:Putative membrane protein YGL010W n=1 Tax=Sinobacterium caligoides TaxID=933926 RepID=A0A3N2E158_9GAMM|nr:Mpo1-like protein [Sinobacterium caligoides]ROS05757.1 putative membrane protein YGL010W [Sinobacterium caligoides]
MRSAESWFSEYGESHRNRVNQLIHKVAVPAIYFSIAGLLWALPQMSWMQPYAWLNWATLILVLVMVFYATLGLRFFVALLLFSLACVAAIAWLAVETALLWQLSLAIFIVAWVLQFVGHKIEGVKPSFFKDILFLLVGPAWVFDGLWRAIKG